MYSNVGVGFANQLLLITGTTWLLGFKNVCGAGAGELTHGTHTKRTYYKLYTEAHTQKKDAGFVGVSRATRTKDDIDIYV